MIKNFIGKNGNIKDSKRRTSARDHSTKPTDIQLLESITTPTSTTTVRRSVTYNGFFKYALLKCRGNLEQAILLVTSQIQNDK